MLRWIDEGIIDVSFAHGLTEKMDFRIGLGYLIGGDSVFLTPEFLLKYNLFPEFISASISSSFEKSSYSIDGDIGNKNGLENWLIGGRYRIFDGLALGLGVLNEIGSESFEGSLGFHYEF